MPALAEWRAGNRALMAGRAEQFRAAVAQLPGWLLDALGADGVSEKDRRFYEGKVGVASFFAKNFLPLLTSTREVIEHLDNEIMELDEAAF